MYCRISWSIYYKMVQLNSLPTLPRNTSGYSSAFGYAGVGVGFAVAAAYWVVLHGARAVANFGFVNTVGGFFYCARNYK